MITDRYQAVWMERAQVLVHGVDGGMRVQGEGDLAWALEYAGTWFDRSESVRQEYRLTEVVLRGEVVASFRNLTV